MKTYQAFLEESLSIVLFHLLQQFCGIQCYVVTVEMYFGMKTNFVFAKYSPVSSELNWFVLGLEHREWKSWQFLEWYLTQEPTPMSCLNPGPRQILLVLHSLPEHCSALWHGNPDTPPVFPLRSHLYSILTTPLHTGYSPLSLLHVLHNQQNCVPQGHPRLMMVLCFLLYTHIYIHTCNKA